jgi:dihydrofolate reductase
MRKIISGLFITLDGVVEAPEKWNPPYYDDEMTQAVMPQIAAADTHLYGRRSYELFRAVFTGPGAARIPHAEMMTHAAKVVVSSSLDHPDWGPTTLISRDVAAELGELKRRPGRDISVGASVTLVRFLLRQGLLDELNLLVHPIVVGSGRRLFEDGESYPLKLLDSRRHRNGVVTLRYASAA